MPCAGCIQRQKYLRKKRKQAYAAAQEAKALTLAKARRLFKKRKAGDE